MLYNYKLESEGNFVNIGNHTVFSKDIEEKDQYSASRFSFRSSPHPGGCGAMLLSGMDYRLVPGDVSQAAFKKAILDYLKRSVNAEKPFKSKVGSFHIIYGQTFWGGEVYKSMINLGFKVVSEYPNHQHGENYNQRLLVLNLDKHGRAI